MSTSPGSSSLRLQGTSPAMYPQFLLFGDSITQASTQSLLAPLTECYLRRLDVLNRGFSGYTAPRGLDLLRSFFPAVPPSMVNPRVRIMSVFFGANDACIPGDPQHVPLGQYVNSLHGIISHSAVELHGTKIILIVPTPVDEWQLPDQNRNAIHTARYADACRQLGRDLDLPVVDLWTTFMKKAGWKPGQTGELPGSRKAQRSSVLNDLLLDGLHLSSAGYKILYDELLRVIEERLPTEVANNLPWVYPDWKDVLAN